jgi:ApaG protein
MEKRAPFNFMSAVEEPSQPTPHVTTSNGVEISVWPELDNLNTNPQNSVYTYRYTIKIRNLNAHVVQLISRQWIITDGFDNVEEVEGDGVVGKQPILRPGEAFLYESFCPLATPTGRMKGTYFMKDADGKSFQAAISEFPLSNKNLIN